MTTVDADAAAGAGSFATALRRRRLSARLTQEELADRAGLSARTVRDLERGRVRHPRPSSVRLLAVGLGLEGRERAEFQGSARAEYWAGRTPPVDPDGSPDPDESAAPPVPAVLAQLPPVGAAFSGRFDELAACDDALGAGRSAASPLLVVTGMAGVGKTALAVYWATRARERFPGGQLFVGLRGSGPGAPVPAAAAAERLLRSLGVPAPRIPAELDDRCALLRSELARGGTLLVLDDAYDSAQVRPLLPASEGTTLVTSRRRLDGLVARDGARLLELDVLDVPQSVALLDAAIGAGRSAAEPDAADRLASLCGGLPLALRIAAARVAPGRPGGIRELVGELAEERGRLTRLAVEDDDTAVRTAFALSYRALPAAVARLFRLMGAQPLGPLDPAALAALVATDGRVLVSLLDVLTGAHLAERADDGRYRLHDLIRLYAREQSDQDPPAEVAVATHRLLDWYVCAAAAGEQALAPHLRSRPRQIRYEPADAVRFSGRPAALAWFDAEASALLEAARYALDHGLPSVSWQLADSQHSWSERHSALPDWLDRYRLGLDAAQRASDRKAEAVMTAGIGVALASRRHNADAVGWLERALSLNRQAGDDHAAATTAMNLGTCLVELGRWESGVEHLAAALATFRAIGERQPQGACLANLGYADRRLGRHEQARQHLLDALVIAVETGDLRVEASIGEDLGAVAAALGRHAEAVDRYERAASVARDAGDRQIEAWALCGLGDVRDGLGETLAARAAWRSALDLLLTLDSSEAEELRIRLATRPERPSREAERTG